jgi:hypothetical protein
MSNENSKDIRYLNRDFDSIKNGLIEFTKTYFPETYQDFSEESIGNVFIELSSYVGDVLSYYTDQQFRENLIQYAEEEENVRDLAQVLGYTPKQNRPAQTEIEVFVVAPVRNNSQTGELEPDFSVVPTIEQGMTVTSSSNPDVTFRTTREVDFTIDRFDDPLNVEIFNRDISGEPTQYLLSKTVPAVAGEVRTRTFDFGSPEPYQKIFIRDDDFIDILEVSDSDGNRWFEVPYLAQETTFQEFKNTNVTDPNFTDDVDVRSLLKLERTPRRFIQRVDRSGDVFLQFGSGASDKPNEEIVPNPQNIGNPVLTPEQQLEEPLDPSNFLQTDTYGQVPYNTTLTIQYSSGGGTSSNVPKSDLTVVDQVDFDVQDFEALSPTKQQQVQDVQDSLSVQNPVPATGGRGPESVQEIKNNARAFFSAQDRAVTKEDYVVRSLNMPSRYGSVAKAYVTNDEVQTGSTNRTEENPLAINLYVLGYDDNKKLTSVNDATKQNLKNYLRQFRMLTDAVNIKDGFVINIGIDFEVLVFSTYNKNQVLARCLAKLREIFDIDNQGFAEPIIIGQVVRELNEIDGVQNVSKFEITNKTGDDYSDNIYDIESATKDNIIYPSLDPSVFEIKFPDRDIRGSAK